ncbi:MAG: hypothetical protein KGZ94_05955 [Clostridia bacterium]|nr:hypothetical protein [Clostridia bacterium]
MKRIDEMKKEEILALTEGEIASLIDLECAYEGIPLLPECPKKAESIKHEKDLTAYEVAGYYFLEPEEAGRVLEVLQSAATYTKDGWGEDAGLKRVSDADFYSPKVEVKKFYSQAKLAEIKKDLEENKRALAAYEKEKERYDRILRDRTKVADRVTAVINEVVETEKDRQFYQAEFGRYLILANNNKEVAMSFLLKTYCDVEHEFRDLITKLCPDYYSLHKEEVC